MYRGCSVIVLRSRTHDDDPSRPLREALKASTRKSWHQAGWLYSWAALATLSRWMQPNYFYTTAMVGRGWKNKGSTKKEKWVWHSGHQPSRANKFTALSVKHVCLLCDGSWSLRWAIRGESLAGAHGNPVSKNEGSHPATRINELQKAEIESA